LQRPILNLCPRRAQILDGGAKKEDWLTVMKTRASHPNHRFLFALIACVTIAAIAAIFRAAAEAASPAPQAVKQLLIVSVTKGYHHSSIPTGEIPG
jgi:hypothetical protein